MRPGAPPPRIHPSRDASSSSRAAARVRTPGSLLVTRSCAVARLSSLGEGERCEQKKEPWPRDVEGATEEPWWSRRTAVRSRARAERACAAGVDRSWEAASNCPMNEVDEIGFRSAGRSSAVIEDDLITDLCLHGTCSADYPPSLTYTSRRTRTPPHLHFHRMV